MFENMDRTTAKQKTQPTQRFAEPNRKATEKRAAFTDNRPEMVRQRSLQLMVENSPFVGIQRKQLENLTGKTLQKKDNPTGMPDHLKSGLETLSGMDMSDVRVHYNSSKPANVQAHAYTQGTDIHISPGQEKHLSHEAWHVAQQKQGRVKPTTEVAGLPVNDNPSLEKEADIMGKKAAGR